MSSSETQPTLPVSRRSSEEDLDGLLSAFFRAELPVPWPGPLPTSRVSAVANGILTRTGSLVRSRVVLAASLLLLLLTTLYLAIPAQMVGEPNRPALRPRVLEEAKRRNFYEKGTNSAAGAARNAKSGQPHPGDIPSTRR